MITREPDTIEDVPGFTRGCVMTISVAAAIAGAVSLPPGATRTSTALTVFIAIAASAYALSKRSLWGWVGLLAALGLAAVAVTWGRPTALDPQDVMDLDQRAAALVCLAASAAILWGWKQSEARG